ncbi:glucan endo-1,3-beta-glucosidase 12 isoform X2 [Impatiens glandulifera]|uniref:glucan endo-1,3-beta-glucosidase 12 isoform X2 n=1 Tax=Impatiens glandulifera TaxID=253017 RepID=UPI001FB10A69|nr:glucan endo-1,3-beta-glucosidase 12 isoform X2 [Impatiens glandulifera]
MMQPWFLPLLTLCFISFISGSSQIPVQYFTLHDPSSPTKSLMAVSIETEDLHEISTSLLAAETWLRDHVFPHYPSSKIASIVVGYSVFCNRNHENQMGLVLPSMKNIFHSLTRWGLEKEIKVSAAFSSNCLYSFSFRNRDDFVLKYVKPILNLLHESNSTYVVNAFHSFSSEQALKMASTHSDSVKTLGDFGNINVLIAKNIKGYEPNKRMLSSIDSVSVVHPFPSKRPRENPAPASSAFPPSDYPFPAYEPQPNLPPLIGTISPVFSPANPPQWGFNNLPPCNPWNGGGVAPAPAAAGGLWCVAKASVPVETLQEAMDYACGEGGGDCEEIQAKGRCFEPDNVLAHASYAFNSYWQKHKRIGGTCNFGGTAILVNSDPSFRGCRFAMS